jgi:hypothetical protein
VLILQPKGLQGLSNCFHNVTSVPGQLSPRERHLTCFAAVGRRDLQGEDQWSRLSCIESSRILKDLECPALMYLGSYAAKQLTDAQPSGVPSGIGRIVILLMVSGSGSGRKRSCLT